MPMPNSPVNHSSSGALAFGNSASAFPSAVMPINSQGEHLSSWALLGLMLLPGPPLQGLVLYLVPACISLVESLQCISTLLTLAEV